MEYNEAFRPYNMWYIHFFLRKRPEYMRNDTGVQMYPEKIQKNSGHSHYLPRINRYAAIFSIRLFRLDIFLDKIRLFK